MEKSYFYLNKWLVLGLVICQFYQGFYSFNSMSRLTTKKVRCHTEAQSHSNLYVKTVKDLHRPLTETLRRQSKFINPYSNTSKRIQSKTFINFQRPHSIALIFKRQQRVKSQIKLSPYTLATQSEKQQQQKYKTDKAIGKGLYSTVYSGYLWQTNQKIAIKKIQQDPKIKNTQIGILKKFNHCNVLTIIDHFYTLENGRRFLCIVTELFDTDLFHFIREKRRRMAQDTVKRYAYQILKGLQELHRKCIVHRDLKSSNIFLCKQTKRVVIGDLGSARQLSLGETISGQPCPFSYRPPQLLFGSNNYCTSSDIWSFGCILLEMANYTLPFKSRNNTEQLLQIINFIGTPTLLDVMQINQDYDQREYEMLPKVKGKGIKDAIHLEHALSDLLKKILIYSPSKRITASEALKHKYFDGVAQNQESFSMDKSMDRSLIFNTPSHRKEKETLNTVTTIQDESPKDIIQQLQLQTCKILLNRNGINIPLKINRKLQF